MAQHMCERPVLANFHSQFCIEIEWLEHFTKLEVCNNWKTKLSMPYVSQMGNNHFEHLHINPKCENLVISVYLKD
jgi:hypothetical protein